MDAGPSPARLPAIFVLGTIGKDNPRVAASFGRLLEDADPIVQTTAMVALAGLGESAKPVVPNLASQLRGPHVLVVAKSLGRLGATAGTTVSALVQVAVTATKPGPGNEFMTSIELRTAALDSLARIGHADAASVEALAELLKDPQVSGGADAWGDEIRSRAAVALGSFGRASKSATPHLLTLAATPQKSALGEKHIARVSALQALGAIGEKSPDVVRICQQCLQDPTPQIRVAAVKTLLDLGKKDESYVGILKGVVEQHSQLDFDSFSELESQSWIALGDAALPALIAIVSAAELRDKGLERAMNTLVRINPRSAEVRLCLTRMALGLPNKYYEKKDARNALAHLGDDSQAHVKTVLQLLSEDSFTNAAIEELGKSGPDAAPAVPKLVELLKSENVDVRLAVVKSLAGIGPRVAEVQPALLNSLMDDEFRVRHAAFEALCRMGPAAAPHAAVLVDYSSRHPGGFGGNPSAYDLANLGTEALLPVILPKLGKDQTARQLFGELTSRNRRRLKGEANAKLLASYLTDENVEVRQLVAGTLRMEMGEEARPVLDDIKKAARDKDPGVAWQACLLLLELLPLDEAVAAAPPKGKADPLKQGIDQLTARLNASGQNNEERMKALQVLRQEASVGYWVRSLKDPDPRMRVFALNILFPSTNVTEAVFRSVLEDRKSSPDLKAAAENALKQIEQSRAQNGP